MTASFAVCYGLQQRKNEPPSWLLSFACVLLCVPLSPLVTIDTLRYFVIFFLSKIPTSATYWRRPVTLWVLVCFRLGCLMPPPAAPVHRGLFLFLFSTLVSLSPHVFFLVTIALFPSKLIFLYFSFVSMYLNFAVSDPRIFLYIWYHGSEKPDEM